MFVGLLVLVSAVIVPMCLGTEGKGQNRVTKRSTIGNLLGYPYQSGGRWCALKGVPWRLRVLSTFSTFSIVLL